METKTENQNNLGVTPEEYEKEAAQFMKKYSYREAIDFYKKALEIREQNPESTAAVLGEANHRLGKSFLQVGLFKEANQHFLKASVLYSSSLEPDDPKLCDILIELAATCNGLGDYEQTVEHIQQAKEKAYSNGSTIQCLKILGEAYLAQRKDILAIKTLKKAEEIAYGKFGKNSREVAMVNGYLANAYVTINLPEKSHDYMNKTKSSRKDVFSENSLEFSDYIHLQAYFALSQGKLEDAFEYAEKALQNKLKILKEERNRTVIEAFLTVGVMGSASNNKVRAQEAVEIANFLSTALMGTRDSDLSAKCVQMQGMSAIVKGEPEAAKIYFNKQISILEKYFGQNTLIVSDNCQAIATMFEKKGYIQSIPYFEKCMQIRDQMYKVKDHRLPEIYIRLGVMYAKKDKTKTLPLIKKAFDMIIDLFELHFGETLTSDAFLYMIDYIGKNTDGMELFVEEYQSKLPNFTEKKEDPENAEYFDFFKEKSKVFFDALIAKGAFEDIRALLHKLDIY